MIIGIQVSSLKPLLSTEAQVTEAFSKMRDLGCTTVQLQWIDPSVPMEAIARALRDRSMESVSVQDFYETVRKNFQYYVSLNAITGGKWLCVSRIPERLKSRKGLDAFIAELRAVQKQLDAFGQELCFHPVSADFTAVPGMSPVDYLLDNMPELSVCLDLYHLNHNCSDMPACIRRYWWVAIKQLSEYRQKRPVEKCSGVSCVDGRIFHIFLIYFIQRKSEKNWNLTRC